MPKAPQIHLSTKASPEVQKLPLTQIIEEYLLQYAVENPIPPEQKKLDLKAFLQFLSRFKKTEPNDLCVGDWDHSACQYFVDTLLERGEAPATVGRRLATIKHMGRVFAERIPGFINPAREIKSPKMQILKPKYLEQEEAKRVVDFAASKKAAKPDFKRIRNEVIVRLLLDTGLRADEIRNLRLQQISEELDWIKQVRTKGRRFRNVYITSECRPHLKKYLEARREQLIKYFPRLSGQIDGKLPVFVSFYRAKPLEPDSFLLSPKKSMARG